MTSTHRHQCCCPGYPEPCGDPSCWDEIVIRDLDSVHIERMSTEHVWMRCGPWVLNFWAKRGHLKVHPEWEPLPDHEPAEF